MRPAEDLIFQTSSVRPGRNFLLDWSSFSKSEFEIGICYEIGILPEHSEQIVILKRNSRDSRNSDDQ